MSSERLPGIASRRVGCRVNDHLVNRETDLCLGLGNCGPPLLRNIRQCYDGGCFNPCMGNRRALQLSESNYTLLLVDNDARTFSKDDKQHSIYFVS